MTEKGTASKKNRVAKFFRETKAELKKVSWPTKKQLINNTLIILAFIIITGVILSVLDIGFNKLIGLLTELR